MVKSKKMSKTSIAVIVLAILLVLSLCLGLTGAWFTNSATGTGGTSSFVYGTVSGTISASEVKHYDATYAQGTGTAGASIARTPVVPGDWLVASATITNTSDVDVYYGIKSGSKLFYVDGGMLVAYESGDDASLLNKVGGTTTTVTGLLENHIETSVEYSATVVAGATVALADSGASYTVYFIQADNIDADDALVELAALASVTLA